MNLHDVMNASTVIALLYAAAAVLCVMVDNAGTAANAAQTPSDFWRWAAIALLLMAISKLLQLDVAFVLWVREKARNGGWYAMRRLIQLMFIATLIAAILGLGWHALQRKALLVQLQFRHSQILAGTGLGLLVMLLAMRYISFHYLDQLLNARLSDLRVGRLGEIGGLTLVSFGASLQLLRGR